SAIRKIEIPGHDPCRIFSADMYASVPVQVIGAWRRPVPAISRTYRSPSNQPAEFVGAEPLRREVYHDCLLLLQQLRCSLRHRAVEKLVRVPSVRDQNEWEMCQVGGVGMVQLREQRDLISGKSRERL